MDEKKKNRCGWSFDSDDWWEDRSVVWKALIVLGFVALAAGLLFLFGWVVMLLWNALMPDIFGLKRITYWQGWGLLILSTILFKGMGSSGGGARSDRRRRRELRRRLREEDENAAPLS